MAGLLAKKVGMTQVFDEQGLAVPVSILKILENTVTCLKSTQTDGYNAVQLGCLEAKEKKLTKGQLGHLKKNNLPLFRYLKEFRLSAEDLKSYKLGVSIDFRSFLKEGVLIDVSAKPKRGGTVGRIKRWNGRAKLATHGTKRHKHIGSCGPGTTPGRVFPGLRMPGRDRNQVTVRKLLVFKLLDFEESREKIVLVKGAVPGPRGSIVFIRKSIVKDWNKTAFSLGKAKKYEKEIAL